MQGPSQESQQEPEGLREGSCRAARAGERRLRGSRRASHHLGPAHHVQEPELPVSCLSLKGWLLCGWTNPHKTSGHAGISPSPSEG